MKHLTALTLCICTAIAISGCKKEDNPSTNNGPATIGNVNFKILLDSEQARLDNLGRPSTIPTGNAAQSPRFNSISAHYIELSEDHLTAVGGGEIVYQGPETTEGGDKAVDFSQAIIGNAGETFVSIPVTDIAPGEYKYLRISLTYQNYDIDFRASGLDLTGTLASFVGYNTYIKNYQVKNQSVSVNDDKLQGYWAFETQFGLSEGQAPEGATTVPNPLFASSPIPQGSCLVSGEFAQPLIITGREEEDMVVNMSFSINHSFEWKDAAGNGIYEPLDGDTVVDMGLRGLIPWVE